MNRLYLEFYTTENTDIHTDTIFFSCHSNESGTVAVKTSVPQDANTKQAIIPGPDTTSSDYLIHLVEIEKPLNYYWTKKLDSLRNIMLPYDSSG